jgi:4-diphosphocytidyl-2-C-methyl-D-erythritol kinase
MDSLTLKSPAKLNLFLEVLKKRKDGFHQIRTIFHAIRFYDFIHLKKSRKNGIFIKTNCKELPTDERNLVYKALKTLRSEKDFGGIEVLIDKRIPLASGLGGGSSNAAIALVGANRLWKLGLARTELYEICKQIGSDVPFFISGYASALGEGRGEILRPLSLPRYWFLLVLPPLAISSKKIYSHLQLNLTRKNKNVKMLTCALKKKDISQIAKKLYNRLEETVLSEFPLVKRAKQVLKTAGCKAILVSGSGPAVFALTLSRKEAIETSKSLGVLGWQSLIVRSL